MSDIAAAKQNVAAARQNLTAATDDYKEAVKSGEPVLTEVAKEIVSQCLNEYKSAQNFLTATREAAGRALLQLEQLQWFRVKFTLSRDKSQGGVRLRLVELAKGGYYPLNGGMEQAFNCQVHPEDNNSRLISVDVVFTDEAVAINFITEVDRYVTTTPGLTNHSGDFDSTTIAPFRPKRLILASHYVPREANGESPLESPVWDVELDAMDISHLTSYYSYNDTVYKYQRVESENAFARCIPEGAHIFPAAQCRGKYEWLDNKEFNRLALSGRGHQQFDGTARGKAKRAKTSPMVAIEPRSMSPINRSGTMFTRINIRLWCRNQNVATNWQPFVGAATLHSNRQLGLPYIDGISISCEQQRRQKLMFEVQQEADGTERRVLLTAIPGVENPRTLESWNGSDETVAVSDIMFSLLQWNYLNTLDTWKNRNHVE